MYALNGATGAKRWEFLTGGDLESSVAIGANGAVFFGSLDGHVYALDAATGAKRWSFQTGGLVMSSPTLGADGTVYVGSWDNRVYALDGSTGTKKWDFLTGGGVYSSPAVAADGTVFVGSGDGILRALDGATGALKWSHATTGNLSSSPALGPDGVLCFGTGDGRVVALETGTTGLAASPWPMFLGGIAHGAKAASVPAEFSLRWNLSDTAAGRLELLADPGATLAVETSTDLSGWTEVGSVTGQGAGQPVTVDTAGQPASEARFWRVIWR